MNQSFIMKGAYWLTTSRFLIQVFNLSANIYIANLLFPSDYALMGISMTVIGIMEFLTEFGLGEVITQRKNLLRSEINCIFWISTVVGLMLSALCFSLSSIIEGFFGKNGVKDILQLLSIMLFMKALTVVPYKLMERKLKFKLKAVIDVVSKTIALILAILFASLGLGVWSLVYSQLINALAICVLSYLFQPFIPYFTIRLSSLGEMISFSYKIVILRALWYIRNYTDAFVGGKFLLAKDFGFYTFAFHLAGASREVIHKVMNIISVPVLARLQNNENKLNEAFLTLVQYTSLVTFPVFIGGAILGEDIIKVLLPEKWLPSAQIFSVACIVQIYRIMNAAYENLYIAKGKPQYSIVMNVFSGIALFGGFMVCIQWKVTGLLLAWMIILPVIFLAWTFFTLRNCNIKFSIYFKCIELPIFGSAAMISVLFILKFFILDNIETNDRLTSFMYLIFNVFFGALTYISVIYFRNKTILLSFFRKKEISIARNV